MSEYTPDHAGMDEFLNSGMLMDVVEKVADRIRDRALTLAPVGTAIEGDEHPGLYISSFRTKSHRFGGATHDRVEAVVYNDALDALWVEFGHFGQEPYHVLLRAATGATL
jgi:hypothetical protein